MLRRFFFVVLVSLGSLSCSRTIDSTVFVIDNSGSMRKENLLGKVKQSAKKIALDYKPGDQFHLISFDSEARYLGTVKVQKNSDLAEFFNQLDGIRGDGNWTNLINALEFSVEYIKPLMKSEEEVKTRLILYTDGIHDIPAKAKKTQQLDFEELFAKYFSRSSREKSWFIYYVELNKADPKLAKLIKESDSGTIISRDRFNTGVNFTQIQLKDYLPHALAGVGGLVLLAILFLIARPWFNDGQLVPQPSSTKSYDKLRTIELKNTKRKWFSRFLEVGSGEKEDIYVTGVGVKERHAKIGRSTFGGVYIQPSGDSVVKIDGELVTRRKKLENGQKVHIGSTEFVYKSKKVA